MAKHRIPKKRRARAALLTVAAAAGISSALVLGQATNSNVMVQLSNTVLGVGGLGDFTGVRVPNKLNGTVVPATYGYEGITYPADLTLSDSAKAGQPNLHNAITARSSEQFLIVTSYSEGTLVAELERRKLQELNPSDAPPNTQLHFVMIASPFAPNGGILGRFPGFSIPVIVDGMGAGVPTRYDTTYIANEYDPYADFPAYFNPLSLLNTALAVRYSHPDEAYDAIIPGVTPAAVTTVHNSAGGYDTYVLVHSAYLPLLGPLRDAAAAVGLTPFSEPVLTAFEPLLRVLVDMGYTDRLNLDPATPTPFSLITPPHKILEALAAIPGALAEGLANFINGGSIAIAPANQNVNALAAPAAAAADSGEPAAKSLPAAAESKSEPEPKAKPEAQAEAKPEPKAEDTALKASAESTSTTSAKAPGDGLHPTVTSDGNKVTPGDSTPSTGTGTTTTTGTTPTTEPAGTTPTAGTPSTTGGTTTGSTEGEASPGSGSEAAA